MPQVVPFQIKVKTCLRMCIQRLRYAQEKQQALSKQSRRDVAQLLANSKEQKAHYRVESLINDDIHTELLELLELYCELLHARVMVLNSVADEADLISNHMADGLNEAVRSLVYCTLHVPEVKEMSQLRDLFVYKFGQEFAKMVLDEQVGVPEKVIAKCSPQMPREELVVLYLQEIAKTYEVPYSQLDEQAVEEQNDQVDEKDETDERKPIVAIDSDEKLAKDPLHPITIRKPRQNSETVHTYLKIPPQIKKDIEVVHKSNNDLDELQKRFAALRR